jgi:hypothetical protein
MSDQELSKFILGETREVRLGEGGVEVRKVGMLGWPSQYLKYDDLAKLIDMKNEALDACGGDVAKGELLWRESVAKKIMPKVSA